MTRIGTLLVIVVLVMMPVMFSANARSMVVETADGDQVWCVPVDSGDTVQLQFTHSMFGGYVRENWLVTADSSLERHLFVTENAAAAEYYATDGSSFQSDDGFVVPGPPLVQRELIVRVNDRGNHVLSVNDDSMPLAKEIRESTQVRIFVTRQSCD